MSGSDDEVVGAVVNGSDESMGPRLPPIPPRDLAGCLSGADNPSGGDLLEDLTAARAAGDPVVLVTVVETRRSVPRGPGTKMLVFADGSCLGTIGGGEMEARVVSEALECLTAARPRTLDYSLLDPSTGDPGVCGGEVKLFLEPYMPPETLLVVGCGHIGRKVADLARWLGFRVVATDDRTELVTPELIPGAEVLAPGPITEVMERYPITSRTAVVVVTRNIAVDLEVIPPLLAAGPGYIGVMGSRRRWDTTRAALTDLGVDDEALEGIHTPVGIDLGAETPEEIALSIMAEVVAEMRGGPR